jgi:hypothetical protein
MNSGSNIITQRDTGVQVPIVFNGDNCTSVHAGSTFNSQHNPLPTGRVV